MTDKPTCYCTAKMNNFGEVKPNINPDCPVHGDEAVKELLAELDTVPEVVKANEDENGQLLFHVNEGEKVYKFDTLRDLIQHELCEDGEIVTDWLLVVKMASQNDSIAVAHAGNDGMDAITRLGMAQAMMMRATMDFQQGAED